MSKRKREREREAKREREIKRDKEGVRKERERKKEMDQVCFTGVQLLRRSILKTFSYKISHPETRRQGGRERERDNYINLRRER